MFIKHTCLLKKSHRSPLIYAHACVRNMLEQNLHTLLALCTLMFGNVPEVCPFQCFHPSITHMMFMLYKAISMNSVQSSPEVWLLQKETMHPRTGEQVQVCRNA